MKRLHVKTQFPCQLADDLHPHAGRIGFVINGQESDTSLVFGNDGIGCDYSGTARFATPLGGNGHTYLANARRQFHPLKGILLQTVKKCSIVIGHAAIAFAKALDGNVKVVMTKDCVTHRSVLLQGGISLCLYHSIHLASPSCHGISRRSRSVQPPRRTWGSAGTALDGSEGLRVRHSVPTGDSASGVNGSLVH